MKTIYCISPFPRLLTLYKEYKVINDIRDSYVITRDDGSIDKMDKNRFVSSTEEMERSKRYFESLKGLHAKINKL